MNINKPFYIATIITIIFLSQASYATIIGANYLEEGDGLITRDTNSGLDWLDVTETQGYSFYNTLYKTREGNIFEEWRFATQDDFITLIQNYTGRIINPDGRTSFPQRSLRGLVSLLGKTHNSPTGHMIFGYIVSETYTPIVSTISTTITNDIIMDWVDPSTRTVGVSNESYGSFLVKNTLTVPEPSTIILLGLGIIFLRFSKNDRFF